VLDLDNLNLGDIADALADQFGGYEHLMLIDPQTGETVYWSADTGIDGNTPIDLDELLEERELIGIRPLPSWVWYQDMPTSPTESPMSRPAAGWSAPSAAKERSAGSRTNSTRSTRTYCRSGTSFATPEPCAAPLNGWLSSRSSTTPPTDTWLATPGPTCPDPSRSAHGVRDLAIFASFESDPDLAER
jgi:hypothetical protein